MPAPGDNGSAIGAVLAHKKKHITYTPYTGVNITSKYDNEVIALIFLFPKSDRFSFIEERI